MYDVSTYVNVCQHQLGCAHASRSQGLPAGDRHRFPPKSLDEDALHPVFLLGHWLFLIGEPSNKISRGLGQFWASFRLLDVRYRKWKPITICIKLYPRFSGNKQHADQVTVSEWTLLWNKSCTDTSPSPFRERLSGDPFQDWTYLTGLFGAHPISNPQKDGKNVEVATIYIYILDR